MANSETTDKVNEVIGILNEINKAGFEASMSYIGAKVGEIDKVAAEVVGTIGDGLTITTLVGTETAQGAESGYNKSGLPGAITGAAGGAAHGLAEAGLGTLMSKLGRSAVDLRLGATAGAEAGSVALGLGNIAGAAIGAIAGVVVGKAAVDAAVNYVTGEDSVQPKPSDYHNYAWHSDGGPSTSRSYIDPNTPLSNSGSVSSQDSQSSDAPRSTTDISQYTSSLQTTNPSPPDISQYTSSMQTGLPSRTDLSEYTSNMSSTGGGSANNGSSSASQGGTQEHLGDPSGGNTTSPSSNNNGGSDSGNGGMLISAEN